VGVGGVIKQAALKIAGSTETRSAPVQLGADPRERAIAGEHLRKLRRTRCADVVVVETELREGRNGWQSVPLSVPTLKVLQAWPLSPKVRSANEKGVRGPADPRQRAIARQRPRELSRSRVTDVVVVKAELHIMRRSSGSPAVRRVLASRTRHHAATRHDMSTRKTSASTSLHSLPSPPPITTAQQTPVSLRLVESAFASSAAPVALMLLLLRPICTCDTGTQAFPCADLMLQLNL